jgi:hypothetical protein
MSDETIFVLNPLASTLRHYEIELVDTLNLAGYQRVEIIPTVEGEGVTSAAQRIKIAVASLIQRVKLGYSMRGGIIVVIWPLFGYLDPLTLWSLCRANRVLMVFHDPTPLRRSYGQSRLSRRVCKWVVQATNTQVLYHTELAQKIGIEVSGIVGKVVPHPLAAASSDESLSPPDTSSPIRVLGQHKLTRTIKPLHDISARVGSRLALEIHGRGWPAVPGWAVTDAFVSEAEFDELVRTSSCVVSPYSSFFQSGVAARCLERGVRIVAPRHEHIVELYGVDWPGLVEDDNDWDTAVLRALETETEALAFRAAEVRQQFARDWASALGR